MRSLFFLICLFTFQAGFCGRIEDPNHKISEERRLELEEIFQHLANDHDIGVYIFAYPIVTAKDTDDEILETLVRTIQRNSAVQKSNALIFFEIEGQENFACSALSKSDANKRTQDLLYKAAHTEGCTLTERISGIQWAMLPTNVKDVNQRIDLTVRIAEHLSYNYTTGEYKPVSFPSTFDIYQFLIEDLDSDTLQNNLDLVARKILAAAAEGHPGSYSYAKMLQDFKWILAYATEHSVLAVWAQIHINPSIKFLSIKRDFPDLSEETIACILYLQADAEQDKLLQAWNSNSSLTGTALHKTIYDEVSTSLERKDAFFRFLSLLSSDPAVVFGDVQIYNKQISLNEEGRISYSYDYDVTNLENNSRVRIHESHSL